MIKMISLKCPECGADISVEDTRKECFCQYCGAKILVTNENEYIYRHIDEAKIKQTEAEQAVKMRKLDLIERKRAVAEKTKKLKMRISIIMGIVGVILMIVGVSIGNDNMMMLAAVGMLLLEGIVFIWPSQSNDDDDDGVDLDLDGKINIPDAVSDYEGKNYSTLEALLVGAGFTNVTCIPLNDLSSGFFQKPGKIKDITINGKSIDSVKGKKRYLPDASIAITYHSFANFDGKTGTPSQPKPPKVKVPSAASQYGNKHYSVIETLFVDAGFTNIKCIPVNDLMIGLFTKPGIVKDVTVDGKSLLFGGKKCSADVPVIIMYHAFAENTNEMNNQQK